MHCDVCANLKRQLDELKARIEDQLERTTTGFQPLYAVLGEYHRQRANFERHRIEVASRRRGGNSAA